MDTETLDKLYLEWSQFTKAETAREMKLRRALREIAESNPNKFDDPLKHANWCMECAATALTNGGR